jgi:prepilin signal peptidase PulO-like enzyme (type II secretory pathway)
MPKLPFRVALVLSSYSPLFAILAYKSRHDDEVWQTLAVIALVSLVALAIVMASKLNEKGPELKVDRSRPKDGDVLAYTATYLVPFLAVDLTQTEGVVIFASFLIVLGIVYVNSDMLFVNPALNLCGYHSFWVTDEHGHEFSLITRRKELDRGTIILPAKVGTYVRLEVKKP